MKNDYIKYKEHLTPINIGGKDLIVDPLWSSFYEPEALGAGGMDLAIYISDGIYVWPCGEGDDIAHCECELCEKVRTLLK